MGFLAGGCSSSSFLCLPFHHHSISLFPAASSPCLFTTSPRTGISVRKERAVMASLRPETGTDGMVCKKRVILLMGFAMVPLLNLKGDAAEQFSAGNSDERSLDQKQKPEPEGNPSQSPVSSLVNVIGLLGSAALAPLYLKANKEKEASAAALESISAKLQEKQAAISFLEKKYETDLQTEKEARSQALTAANEEKQELLKQMENVNQTITSLKEELNTEKRITEERGSLIEKLESSLQRAGEEKRHLQEQIESKLDMIAVLEERLRLLSTEIKDKELSLQNVRTKFVEKERELAELVSSYEEARDQMSSLELEIQELKDADLKKGQELESHKMLLNDLKMELASTQAEIIESRKNLNAILEEYENFKSSVEVKAAADAKLLGEREQVVQKLEDQLKVALDDLHEHRAVATESTKERDDLAALLSTELENVKNLEQQLHITQDSLDKSKAVGSDLTKQLQSSKALNSQLESEVLKIKDEFSKARTSLEKDISEAKREAEAVAGELKSAKEKASKKEQELQNLSHELSAVVQERDSLEKQLAEARQREEKSNTDLENEKSLISAMKTEMDDLAARMSAHKAAKESLEAHIQEVKKSLDEMKQHVLTLSKELDAANSDISSAKAEKESLQKALDEQKKQAQEAKEHLEEAHSVVMRIGEEREMLEMRGKKLEDELASAKGKILRLSSEARLSADQNDHQQAGDANSSPPVPARRAVRRRKVTTSQRDGS